jgi:hypothetical protein
MVNATEHEAEFSYNSYEESIAWKTYDDYMRYRSSKSHSIDPENDGKTLCGTVIPASGNGIEVGHGSDYGEGECKRCAKKAAA